jgi:hypothetical protein
VRHVSGGWLEFQLSAERLRDQGQVDGQVEPDTFQVSASTYA